MASGKNKIIIGVAVGVTILVLVVLVLRLTTNGSGGVSYKGRTLSQWVDQIDENLDWHGVSWAPLPKKTAKQREAAEAIRAIGTNGIPFLLEGLHATDSSFYEKKEEFLKFLHTKTHPNDPYRNPPISPAQKTRWKMGLALEALGPLAEPATNELQRVLSLGGGNENPAREAALILAGMGPKGVSILTNTVTARNDWPGICALWALGQHPESATNLVPFLIKIAGQSNETLAFSAVWTLGQIHTEPEQVIPVLIPLLKSPGRTLPGFAVTALGEFGADAREALPELKQYADAKGSDWAAKESIKKIKAAIAAEKKATDGKK